METTIGGNRLGSGKKMKAHLNNYFRSTHNLSEKFVSALGSGILYPCFVKPVMRGDVFDISISADARTIPTKGPLFGSYKLQIDFFQCPMRLYQAILHNNPLAIGLKASQVKLPMINTHTTIGYRASTRETDHYEAGKFSKSCLLKYLGVSGMGVFTRYDNDAKTITRRFNAIPVIAYYDIFKTYYANKQEEKGYYISGYNEEYSSEINQILTSIGVYGESDVIQIDELIDSKNVTITIYGKNMTRENVLLTIGTSNSQHLGPFTLEKAIEEGYIESIEGNKKYLYITLNAIKIAFIGSNVQFDSASQQENKLEIVQFNLSKLDDMRYYLLTKHELGTPVILNNGGETATLIADSPYRAICGQDTYYKHTLNQMPHNGLVLKTYQNDLFNNWLNKNWIEGEGSIAELSKVAIVDGAFTMDALNFAQKLYNMLNRVAVTDGTYESWQDVMWEEIARKQIESPIFLGGLSQEVVFDEIVQTAPADGDPLGTLGGRGRLVKESRKGGKIHVKIDEASFIIGIVSLTPRIFYTQGNEFYMTDLESIDDLHKPGMDGIGFQDLIGERLAWFDTKINNSSHITSRTKIGKVPAWIEYMTSYDRAYGDLAEEYGKGYMILNRNYEMDEETLGIKDATTYVDPTKYNYAFAYTALDAQNFWVEIVFGVKARRKMSARLIPNV